MSEPATPAEPETSPADRRLPLVTYLAAAISVVVFFLHMGEPDPWSWETLARYGVLDAWSVYDGGFHTLLTSVFVHGGLMHIAFNLYWLWILGRVLERRIGSWRYLGFFVAAAWVSSACELAVADETGVGLSGVGYALFGFMWIARPAVAEFRKVVDHRVVSLFLVWAVFCVAATHIGVMNIANTAHFSGLAFGGLVGGALLPRWRRVGISGASLVLVLATVTLFWAPWSVAWVGLQAWRADEADDVARAVEYYSRAIDLEPEYTGAYERRAYLRARLGELDAAAADCNHVVALDPASGDGYRLRAWINSERGNHSRALADYRRAIEIDENDHGSLNSAAWLMTTAPDPNLHDYRRAVNYARRAVRHAPDDASYLNTLGVALYRIGEWRETRDTLARAMAARDGGGACDWLFAAMADFRLGNEAEARRWLAKATAWLDAHPDDQNAFLDGAREEAATLLGEAR
jgi:GlpG protein